MEWDEEIKDRLYATIHGKLNEIWHDCSHVERPWCRHSAERFYLVRKIYLDHMDSLGVLTTRWKKSRKVPPHWVVNPEAEFPADTENGVVIPDPFYSDKERPRIKDNYERELGLLVPKDTARKILVMGLP